MQALDGMGVREIVMAGKSVAAAGVEKDNRDRGSFERNYEEWQVCENEWIRIVNVMLHIVQFSWESER